MMDLNDKIRRDLSRVMGMGEEAREEGNAECDRLEALGWKWISELNQHADPDIARNKKAYDISQAISILGVDAMIKYLGIPESTTIQVAYVYDALLRIAIYKAYELGRREALAKLVLGGKVSEG